MSEELEHPWDKQSVEWDINPGDLVIDVGGYKGRWVGAMLGRYPQAEIHVFEPQVWAADIIEQRFGGRLRLFRVALGTHQAQLKMGGFGTDGGSILKDSVWFDTHPDAHRDEVGDILMVDADQFLRWSTRDRPIKLMLINIEGYEYELIPFLIGHGWADRIECIMVQFHTGYVSPTTHSSILAQMDQVWSRHFDYGDTLRAWRKNLGAENQPDPQTRANAGKQRELEREVVRPIRRPAARRGVQK